MKKTVILVEDDESIRDVINIILERAGYDVICYEDGQKLINGISNIPDIFLIDRQLSGIDGIDLCRHLKEQPSTASVPVIILSATPGLENLAKNAGAIAFIEKPFSMSRLMEMIESHLNHH